MPIKYSGKHRCDKCQRIFEWAYFETIRQSASSSFYQVEALPDTKLLVHRFVAREDGSFDATKNCPFCDYYNRFVFDPTAE
ncbi:MAG: hypothetical protein IJ418_17635 [Clostridia bacterium]|nr:hypothetical protein [Clostridia bacterium]